MNITMSLHFCFQILDREENPTEEELENINLCCKLFQSKVQDDSTNL